jgi:hypothetical protein
LKIGVHYHRGGGGILDIKGLVLHKDNFVRFKGYMYPVFIYFCDFIALVESDFSVHVFDMFSSFELIFLIGAFVLQLIAMPRK